ncbi:MAG: hydroxymethylbilane synthase [Actinobacteria bacterium]|nr:hydroxymethylbilane synthase [Actinomycetota bacterium]
MNTIRIATRGSDQARTQAEAVGDALRSAWSDLAIEYVIVSTTGDQKQDVPLHQIGGQGVFVKEVQNAVLDGRADLAVHSAKDLPAATHPELAICAFVRRRYPRDALIGVALNALEQGATVATGSIRRKAQLRRLRPDLQFVELRGNIRSRLGKVPAGGSIVMALAALEILGETNAVAEVLDISAMVPMVGQGCVAVECSAHNSQLMELMAAVDHAQTRRDVSLERIFLDELGAGCSMPIGAHVIENDLHVFMASENGNERYFQKVFDLTGAADEEQLVRAAAREARTAVA